MVNAALPRARALALDEAEEIAQALKPYEEAEAKQRQREAGKQYGRGSEKQKACGKKPQANEARRSRTRAARATGYGSVAKNHQAKEAKKSRTRAARATGYSAATLAKVTEIKAAAGVKGKEGGRTGEEETSRQNSGK